MLREILRSRVGNLLGAFDRVVRKGRRRAVIIVLSTRFFPSVLVLISSNADTYPPHPSRAFYVCKGPLSRSHLHTWLLFERYGQQNSAAWPYLPKPGAA